jgi:hypothetical protein
MFSVVFIKKSGSLSNFIHSNTKTQIATVMKEPMGAIRWPEFVVDISFPLVAVSVRMKLFQAATVADGKV